MRSLHFLLLSIFIRDIFSYVHSIHQQHYRVLNIKRHFHGIIPATGIGGMNAVNDENTGFFRLPEKGNSSNNEKSFPEIGYDDGIQEDITIDDLTKNRVYRQLLFAFDNYQGWEIKEMNQKLQNMPLQFQKLLLLTVTAEQIEAAAEKEGGFDEYLYDSLRTCRSSIRMWGKDAEFFDMDGNDKRGLEKPFFSWPSWMMKK
jgi:hypothetical protein